MLLFVILCQGGLVDSQAVAVEPWYPPVPGVCFQVEWHPTGAALQRVALSWDPTEPPQRSGLFLVAALSVTLSGRISLPFVP